jgi:hypothetical protein
MLAKRSVMLAKRSARFAKRSARLAKKAGARLANERARLANERARLAKEQAKLASLRKEILASHQGTLDIVPVSQAMLSAVSFDASPSALDSSNTVLVVGSAGAQSFGPNCTSLWSPASPAIDPQRPLWAEPPLSGAAQRWLADQFFVSMKMCRTDH